jgi:hypothetical protein
MDSSDEAEAELRMSNIQLLEKSSSNGPYSLDQSNLKKTNSYIDKTQIDKANQKIRKLGDYKVLFKNFYTLGQLLKLRGLVGGCDSKIDDKIKDVESYIKTDIFSDKSQYLDGDIRPLFMTLTDNDSLGKDSENGTNLNIKLAVDYFYMSKGLIIDEMNTLIEKLSDPETDCTYEYVHDRLNAVLKAKSSVNIDTIKDIKKRVAEELMFKVMTKKGPIGVSIPINHLL